MINPPLATVKNSSEIPSARSVGVRRPYHNPLMMLSSISTVTTAIEPRAIVMVRRGNNSYSTRMIRNQPKMNPRM